MRVGILGPLEVVTDGGVVAIGGARLRTLLVRLALDAGRVVTVESLASALWPDNGPADRGHALQALVSRLRRALPEPAAVRSAPGGYCLDVPPDAVDAVRFERLAAEGRRALRGGAVDVAARALQDALDLWRGEALADAAGAPFAVSAAAHLAELRLSAAEDLAEARLSTGEDHASLVAQLEALTAAHPLRERPRGLLVRALHAAGRRAEALRAYEDFRRLLKEELGTDPGPTLQAAYLAVLRAENPDPPPAARPGGNLRAALTSFVGRDAELARIDRQLAERRLVTLVGPGGAGKSRLAVTAAARLAAGIANNVWLVELAAVTDPADVAGAILDALGRHEPGALEQPYTPRDPVGRLVEALSGTEALLVLDNCEHLLDAAGRLVEELLGQCPQLRVLATSREPLAIAGEALYRVPPLAVPPPDASAAAAMDWPAVRLFADRAAAVRPEFAVTEDNVAEIVKICRRLDGLPLAIELAAARLRSLPVERLAAGLDDRFALLTSGSRTAAARHRTLRAALAWSWGLLDDEERRFAQRLAVFPATISLEAAERVGAPDGGTLDLVSALVDKSLLQLLDGAEPRYRMLETIREYALERLDHSGALTETRAAHAGYFLRLAETAAPHLRGPDQIPWLVRLRAERDNLLAALRFACDTADADTAVRLAAALSPWWTIQGGHAEASSWLRTALDVPGPAPSDARADATAGYLFNVIMSGGGGRPDIDADEVRARIPTAEGHPLLEPALTLIAGDTVRGLPAIDRRLPGADPWTRAMLRLMRAFLQANDGDMVGMGQDLAAAAAAFRAAGERWGRATALTYLAYTRSTFGDFDGAIAALEEPIRLLRELDPNDDAILQRVWLAEARARAGDVERAQAELRALVAPGGTSPGRYRIFARLSLGDHARLNGDLAEAARQYAAAWPELDRVPVDASLFRSMICTALGHLAAARGDLAAAQRQFAQAAALATDGPDMPLAAIVGVGVARLRADLDDALGAAELLGAAHALRGASDEFNPDVARLVAQLRDRLDEPAYRSAYARGQSLDRAGALALIRTHAGRP